MKHPETMHPFAAKMLAAKREKAKLAEQAAANPPAKRVFQPVRKPAEPVSPVVKGILAIVTGEQPKPAPTPTEAA